MTAAITADMFARTPPFARAAEALNAIRAQHGRARAAAWARSSEDDIRSICAIAVVLENTALALNLLRDLDEAQRSGNDRKLAMVRRRLDRVLVALETKQEAING
jgi:plasmid stability protein